MENNSLEQGGTGTVPHSRKTNVIMYLAVLTEWKKFIVYNVLIITAIAALVSFFLPRWYLSSSTILPPRNQGITNAFDLSAAGLMRQFVPFRGLGGSSSAELYNYMAILKSRSLSEKIINEFNLFDVYGIGDSSMGDAIEGLKSNVDFKVNEEGTLQIEVLDRDRNRAAAMANSYVRTLDGLNQELSVREARSNREFIEQRITKTKDDLAQAEDALKNFQESKGFVMIPQGSATNISSVADLYAKKALKEVEVGILSRTVAEGNPELQMARIELSELDKKLLAIPEMGMSYLRLYRDYAIQEKIFETLTPLLEQAKINEKKDTPTLLVLDNAVPAERAAKPKKKLIVVIFFLLSIILSVTVALFMEAVKRLRNERKEEFDGIRNSWQAWIRRSKPR